MKLTSTKWTINYSIYNSVYSKCIDKIYVSTTFNVRSKIQNEIQTPNRDSISDMQIRILNNLQNEMGEYL